MQIPVAGPGNYSIVMSLLDSLGYEVVPPTPALLVTIQPSCANVTTVDAVFSIP